MTTAPRRNAVTTTRSVQLSLLTQDTLTVTDDAHTPRTETRRWFDVSEFRIRKPGKFQKWCSANPTLYLDVLADPPTADDSPQVHEAYAEGLETGRNLCEACPVWSSCLKGALEGPATVEGFIAGTTSEERQELRAALNVTAREVHVHQFVEGKQERRHGQIVDHAYIWALHDAMPDARRAEIAAMAQCSEATVKRVLARARPDKPGQDAEIAAYWEAHPSKKASDVAREFNVTVGVVKKAAAASRGATSRTVMSEPELRGAYDSVVAS